VIVFLALLVVAGFTAGYATCSLMVSAADADRRYVDALARRDREVAGG
jgi:hypothetical protein